MQIKVVLDSGGAAVAGVDRDALIGNIQAELDKLTANAGMEPAKPIKKAAPKSAQGDVAIIQWLIDVATNPAMAKVYAQALVFALNEILRATKQKDVPRSKSTSKTPPRGEFSVRITVLGKQIALPAATSAIKGILDKLGGE
jgi:hypothetical protein